MDISSLFKYTSRMFQGCFKNAARLLQGCLRKIQGCFKGDWIVDSRMLQEYSKNAKKKGKRYFYDVSWNSQ